MLRILVVLLALISTAACTPRPTTAVVVVGGVQYPSQIRVGGTNAVSFTLRNPSSYPAGEIMVMLNHEFFNGFNLNATDPELTRPAPAGEGPMRTLRFPALDPGGEQEYRLSVTAKAPGEYRFSGFIKAGGADVKPFSGRSVVNP